MRRVLMIFIVFLIILGFSFNVSGLALSEWHFSYKADKATCIQSGKNIDVYVENGVVYLSTNISTLTRVLKEGMRVTLNMSSEVSPKSVSSGIKIVLGKDVMIHRSVLSGSYTFQFYTLHSYNITDKFIIVLYDYGGNMSTVIKGIHIENPRGGVGEGVFLTGIGISVVFIVLSILAGVMYALKPVVEKGKKEEIKEKAIEKAKVVSKEVEKMEVNEEIVAAITGALSLYLGGKKFKIISVKPSHWKYYGRFRSMR